MDEKEPMKIELEVRDYECDVQGIVNNAVYLNYLEHARHKFLLARDIDFVELAKEDKNLVLREANYVYHKSLFPDDKFTVDTKAQIEGKLKMVFLQEIYRGDELVLNAKVTGACVSFKDGKIFKIEDIVDPKILEG